MHPWVSEMPQAPLLVLVSPLHASSPTMCDPRELIPLIPLPDNQQWGN